PVLARRAVLRLQLGLDGLEQPEAHRAVVASERDHEAHSPMLGSLGIARQGTDAGKGAGLELGAVAVAEQSGMRLKEVQQLGKAASASTSLWRSLHSAPLSITPRTMRRQCVSGSASQTTCAQPGMPRNG